MTAKELIIELSKLSEKQKDLPIRLINDVNEDLENIWLYKLELSEKGTGYETEGEIRLIGIE